MIVKILFGKQYILQYVLIKDKCYRMEIHELNGCCMKKLFFTLAIAGFAMFSNAQETIQVSEEVVIATDGKQVVTNPYGDNWFISVNGGIHLYNGVVTKGESPFEHISPALSVYGGKWHTPGFGWRVGYNGLNIKPFKNSTHYALLNFHFDALLNLSNLIFGYNEERIWNLIPYVGAGWAGRTYDGHNGLTGTLSANYGILNTFRIAKRWAVNLELSGYFFRNGFGGKFGKEGHDMMWSLTAGITYRLGKVGWSPAIDPAVLQAAYGGVIANLEADVVEARNMNDMARREIASLNNKLNEMNAECRKMQAKVAHDVVDFKQSVFFPFGSSKLDSKKEELNIEAYAKAAAAAGMKLKVIGFTDSTGSVKYNEMLSKQRAESVAELLRANGAMVETVIGQGESEEYKAMYLNRRAIIEVVK